MAGSLRLWLGVIVIAHLSEFCHSQLREGDDGVCSMNLYFVGTESRMVSGSYRLVYVRSLSQKHVCCAGFFTEVGNSCLPLCMPPCKNGGRCAAPFFCNCTDKWAGRSCEIDINECHLGVCGRAMCTNLPGSHRCFCRSGLMLAPNGRQCVDINECNSDANGCSHECVNLHGGYRCTCPNGWKLENDQKLCTDVNECLRSNGGCEHNCVNTNGSFYCTCPNGFLLRSDQRTCEDINECIHNNGRCAQICINTIGSYHCQCMEGYEVSPVDTKQCTDIDECIVAATGCQQLCVNTVGSYVCRCEEGFSIQNDGKTCDDNDECNENNGGCERICMNTYGSFKCSCPGGFTLGRDGTSCEGVPCPELLTPTNANMQCTPDGFYAGTVCQFSCLPGYDLQGSDRVTCQPEGIWNVQPPVCSPGHCPVVDVQHLIISLPCSTSYNSTCTVQCEEGYAMNESQSVNTISCSLSQNRLEWNPRPQCLEQQLCSVSPCQHGGVCYTEDLEQKCNCTGTGYAGITCELGIIKIPDIPPLKISESFELNIEWTTEKLVYIEIIATPNFEVQPDKLTLTPQTESQVVVLSGNVPGSYQINILISGPGVNEVVYLAPTRRLVLVTDSHSDVDYFQSRGLMPGLLQSGSCTNREVYSCMQRNMDIVFKSTCSWHTMGNVKRSAGVIFADVGDMEIPLSVSGISINGLNTEMVTEDLNCTCASCEPCYQPSASDVLTFYNLSALAKTFVQSASIAMPAWLSLSPDTSDLRHIAQHHLAQFHSSLDIHGCKNMPLNPEGDLFVTLVYYGDMSIQVADSEETVSSGSTPICIAISACLGRDSPVFISLPEAGLSNLDLLKDFSSKGWNVSPSGLAASPSGMIHAPHDFSFDDHLHLAIKGTLSATQEMSGLKFFLSCIGVAGLNVENLDNLLERGLSQRTKGMMNGECTISLKSVDDRRVLYHLSGFDVEVDIHIGQSQHIECGLEIMKGQLVDQLFARGFSTITTFMEIPPDLRHGTRYRFECPIIVSLFANLNTEINGMQLLSDCHDLRIGGLLFKGLSHKVFFGMQARDGCRDEDIPAEILQYPVLLISDISAETLQLGPFISVNAHSEDPEIICGLDPSTDDYAVIVKSATITMFGASFTTDISISGASSQLRFQSTVSVYQHYQFVLEGQASCNNIWNEMSYNITGTAVIDNGTRSIGSDIDTAVRQKLEQIAQAAHNRLEAARSSYERVQEVSDTLQDKKTEQSDMVAELQRELQLTNMNISILESDISNIAVSLKALGDSVTALSAMLDTQCNISICSESCTSGFVNSTCTDIVLQDVEGMCLRPDVINVTRWVHVGSSEETDCEDWATVRELRTNCNCGGFENFADCVCGVDVTEGPQCVPVLCRIEYYATVTSQRVENVWRPCVVRRIEVEQTRPCSVMSDCANLIPDEMCVEDNANCIEERNRILETVHETEMEAVSALMNLQNSNRQLASMKVKRRQLVVTLDTTQMAEMNLESECSQLNNSISAQNLRRIEESNKIGIALGHILNSHPGNNLFRVVEVSFSAIVEKESPSAVPMKVKVELPINSLSITVTFDFENIDRSLNQLATLVSEEVIKELTGASSRRKRQSDILIKTPSQEVILQQQCADLQNLVTFYGKLTNSIKNLREAASNLIQLSEDLAIQSFGYVHNESGVYAGVGENITDDPEVRALHQLKLSLGAQALETATVTTANLFILWQAELNIFINASGEVFGYECWTMADCFASSVEVLESILNSAPQQIVVKMQNATRLMGRHLQSISDSINMTLEDVEEHLRSVVDIIQSIEDLGYWCTTPPILNNSYSTQSNISVQEHSSLILDCSATDNYNDSFIKYKWKRNGLELPMQQQPVLAIYNVTEDDAGNYTCEAFNHAGKVETPWTFVTVLIVPVFYLEPVNQTRLVGDINPAKMKCNATSSPNPQFRWHFKPPLSNNFTVIENQAGNEYHIAEPQQTNEGWYRCEAWIDAGNGSDLSIFSQPAYLAVVNYSISVLSIPIDVTLIPCTGTTITQYDVKSTVDEAIMNITSLEDNDTRPSLFSLGFSAPPDASSITMNLHIMARNASMRIGSGINHFVDITESISVCRRALFRAVTMLKSTLATASLYKGQMVCNTRDVSPYYFLFLCPPGQDLQENFIFCQNCPPGTYQSSILKTLEDPKGVPFTVNMQHCLPCPAASYQPDEGRSACIPCPSRRGVVSGAITEEHCLPIADCGDPGAAENGMRLLLNTTAGANVTYLCDDGFSAIGSTILECQYNGEWSRPPPTCQDINECSIENGSCQQECVNLPGSYTCECKAGFRKTGIWNCTDINECAERNAGCEHFCNNVPGSYVCICSEGYALQEDGHKCTDINECSIDNGRCQQECVNLQGSYSCECKAGFQRSGMKNCTDINECAERNAGCAHSCNNVPGSYECACSEGYALQEDMHNCADINECSMENGRCQHECINFPGNYTCECKPGFQRAGMRNCTDINECLLGQHDCDDQRPCQNSLGGYVCKTPTCNTGFQFVNGSCRASPPRITASQLHSRITVSWIVPPQGLQLKIIIVFGFWHNGHTTIVRTLTFPSRLMSLSYFTGRTVNRITAHFQAADGDGLPTTIIL